MSLLIPFILCEAAMLTFLGFSRIVAVGAPSAFFSAYFRVTEVMEVKRVDTEGKPQTIHAFDYALCGILWVLASVLDLSWPSALAFALASAYLYNILVNSNLSDRLKARQETDELVNLFFQIAGWYFFFSDLRAFGASEAGQAMEAAALARLSGGLVFYLALRFVLSHAIVGGRREDMMREDTEHLLQAQRRDAEGSGSEGLRPKAGRRRRGQ